MAKEFMRSLPVKLTEAEAKQKASELARKCIEQVEADDERKEVAKKAKERCDEITAQVNALARIVRDGAEYRNVTCYESACVELLTVETIRTDTGEVVSSRPMTETEIQAAKQGKLKLFGKDATASEAR